MKGILMMLKALGLDIPPEQIAMLQVLIPQLPAKINEASAAINGALQNFDSRLRVLEAGQAKILEELKYGNTGRILDTPRSASSSGNGSGN